MGERGREGARVWGGGGGEEGFSEGGEMKTDGIRRWGKKTGESKKKKKTGGRKDVMKRCN